MVVYTLEQRACDRLTEHADFGKKKIIFAGKAHFDLGRYVNKQSCHIWGTEKPHTYIEKPTHPKWVTIWCGFWFRSIIGPFFLRKWTRRGRYSQWRSLSGHVGQICVHKNWREGYWQHLVSIGRRYVPRSRSDTRCFASWFWRSHYQPQSCCPLARNNWGFKGQFSWSHWWNTAAHNR